MEMEVSNVKMAVIQKHPRFEIFVIFIRIWGNDPI